jgi:Mrp family chromosome partitioning ATPase
LGALAVTSVLRPVYTATALMIVEPAAGSLLEGGAPVTDLPGNAAVDGVVEIMRSEPVLTRAMEMAEPFALTDLPSGFDLKPGFLGFFRIAPEALEMDETGRAQALKLVRNSVSINRRGLTPVVAISARASEADLAARLANAVGEAQISLSLAAKTENLHKARGLIDGQIEAARAGVQRLTGMLDGFDLTRGADIAEAEQDLGMARRQLARLLERAHELDELAGLQMPDARLAAPASVPLEASFPDIRTTLAIAGLFGLVSALALAFTLDGFASGVRSTTELAEAVGVPAAVAMPRVSMLRFDGTSHADQVITAPLSPFSEGMRTLQVNLQRHLTAGAGQVIFVLSPGDGEGKTTTALGLARAFDAAGRGVLLLDADVRSAALRRHVDVPLSGGFEQVLAGQLDIGRLAGLVRRDPLSRLSVLVNSDRSAAPAEALFGGPTFAGVLRSLRASYDITIVDMPSLHWSAEAAYLLPHADAVVMVASWGKTERTHLREALATIRQAHPAPLPLVPVLSLQPEAIRWRSPRYEPGYSSR